jgi:hypothetical protein
MDLSEILRLWFDNFFILVAKLDANIW